MADPSRVDWADGLMGAGVGALSALAGLFGWFNGKLGKIHDRIDLVQERANAQASSIAVLEAHHGAKMERLERIEDNLAALNKKQDRQMEILLDLQGTRR